MKQYVFFGVIAIGALLAVGVGLRLYRGVGIGPQPHMLAEVRRSVVAEPVSPSAPAPAKRAQKKTLTQTVVKETLETPPQAVATPPAFSDVSARVAPSFTLSLLKSGEGNGIVTSVPEGINCGTSCSFVFVAGTRVALRATPGTGSWFDGWINCEGIGECVVTLSREVTITASFSRLPSSPSPAQTSVTISEIFYDAAGSDVGKEFIEFYNSGDTAIDLSGWSLSNGDKTLLKIGSGEGDHTTISKEGFFLIGFNKYTGIADAVRSASLPNTSADIILNNSDGVMMEEVHYGAGGLMVEKDSGASLERRVWEGATSFTVQPNPNPRHSLSPQ